MAKYCAVCGKELKEGSKFCMGCGNPITPTEKMTSAPKKKPVTPIKWNINWKKFSKVGIIGIVAVLLASGGVFLVKQKNAYKQPFENLEKAVNERDVKLMESVFVKGDMEADMENGFAGDMAELEQDGVHVQIDVLGKETVDIRETSEKGRKYFRQIKADEVALAGVRMVMHSDTEESASAVASVIVVKIDGNWYLSNKKP